MMMSHYLPWEPWAPGWLVLGGRGSGVAEKGWGWWPLVATGGYEKLMMKKCAWPATAGSGKGSSFVCVRWVYMHMCVCVCAYLILTGPT